MSVCDLGFVIDLAGITLLVMTEHIRLVIGSPEWQAEWKTLTAQMDEWKFNTNDTKLREALNLTLFRLGVTDDD